MVDKGNAARTDSPYVTSSISDKIKAIKNQLSVLNEEIDSKIAVRYYMEQFQRLHLLYLNTLSIDSSIMSI